MKQNMNPNLLYNIVQIIPKSMLYITFQIFYKKPWNLCQKPSNLYQTIQPPCLQFYPWYIFKSGQQLVLSILQKCSLIPFKYAMTNLKFVPRTILKAYSNLPNRKFTNPYYHKLKEWSSTLFSGLSLTILTISSYQILNSMHKWS